MIPHNPTLRQLRDLDRTSPEFHEHLSNFFCEDAYRRAFPDLGGEDFTWLVGYLDNVLADIPNHATPMGQEFLHEFGKICGAKKVLPKSCALSDSLLGCVYEGTYKDSKVRIRRVKVRLGGDTRNVEEAFHRAAAISKHLEHPNIVPLLGVTTDPLELISGWMPGGDLMGYISNHKDVDRSSLLSDVAEGLHYLHSRNVIHGDLKFSNILVDATGHARITDFGLATVTRDPDAISCALIEHDQDARWIAPEILGNQGTYSKESDVFSFAGVAIEVFTGATPFSDKPPHEVRLAVAGGERPPRPTHRALRDGLWELIQRCWDQEPHLRPRALRISCGFGIPVWKRMVELPLASEDQIYLITDIFSDDDETEVVKHLCGNDAQTFVDVIDKTLDSLGPGLWQKCLKILCKVCGDRALLPRSLQIPVSYDPSDDPLYRGGYADVWIGEHQGSKVVVKVLKVFSSSDLDEVTRRFCKEVLPWRNLYHPNVLPLLGVTMSNGSFAMVSRWMVNGNINEFLKEHRSVNRFELLKDVARGLVYLHDQAMVHGDLKGANILIDQDYRARLADFGHLNFVPDPENHTVSNSTANPGGTIRWMSPELLYPQKFGFNDARPRMESDYYALGMVILEVLGGQVPYAQCKEVVVIGKVVDGKIPERPEVMWFTDELWEILEECWSSKAKDRPSVQTMLECLERVSLATTVDSQQRLISRSFSQGELPYLLETIAWNCESANIFQSLPPGDSQVFVDVLDETLRSLSLPQDIRKKCLQSLWEMCCRRAIFPTSLKIELDAIQTNAVLYSRGSANVSKHNHQGREVAVKTLRTSNSSDLQAITRRFCKEFALWNALRHPNILPLIGVIMTGTELTMVSEWMPNGNINRYVKKHQDANRFELLSDVTKGLICMHDQGMIHGDLKGGNILVDQTSHACIADFGLTILSDSTISNLRTRGGTVRWMSPELFDSEAQDCRPSKCSDCYALGMVVYEVLSLRMPFYQYQNRDIPSKVVQGDRPERPEGADGVWFTDEVWEVLEGCWVPEPQNRPSTKDVLRCLEKGSMSRVPPSHQNAGASTDASRIPSPSRTTRSQSRERPDPAGNYNEQDPPVGEEDENKVGRTSTIRQTIRQLRKPIGMTTRDRTISAPNTANPEGGAEGQYELSQASGPPGELPPRTPGACFGRDELIKEIIGLAESLEPIALIGAGGIGKTSIALTVLHHDRIVSRFGDNRRFIRCDRFPPSRVGLLNRLSEVVGAGIKDPEDLTTLRSFLSSTEMILILDDAESILDPHGTNSLEIRSVIEELSHFSNICLCITSRISTVPPHFKRPVIAALTTESACDIFYDIYNHRGRPDTISHLVKEVDFHALSITLLAATASHNNWNYDQLAWEWDARRTRAFRTDYGQSLASTVESSLTSPTFRNLGPNARNLLEIIAFFPQGVDRENLDQFFPTISNRRSIIDNLCVLSLTHRHNGFITMFAPFRDYLSLREPQSSPLLRRAKDWYFERLSVFIEPGGPEFRKAQWITSEDLNVERLLGTFISIDPNTDEAWDACVHFLRHLYWHKPRQTVLRSKIESLPDDNRSKPKCLFQLSRLSQAVGNRAEQKDLLTQTLRLEREWRDDSRVAQALAYLSDVNRLLDFQREGMRQAEEALKIYKRLGDVIGQANSLNNLAWLLLDDKRLGAAEDAASRAINLIPEKGQEFIACESHRVLGSIYQSKRRKEKAIYHFQMALGIASPFNWHIQLFWVHFSLAGLFLDENRFDDAHAHSEHAKSHAAEDRYHMGRAMEMQARVFYRQRVPESAATEALDALEIFEELGADKDVGNCKELLKKIERGMKSRSANLQRVRNAIQRLGGYS